MPRPLAEMEHTFDSQPRNPVISKLFRLARLAENLGYGLKKLKSWQTVTGCPMHIETAIDAVKVTFDLKKRETGTSDDAKNDAKNLTARQMKILELIKATPTISLDKIAETLGVSAPTVDREIAKMAHCLKRIGPKKGGRWEIIPQS